MGRRVMCVAAVLGSAGLAFGQTPYGPSPYLAFTDGPFAPLSFSSFYLEDFRDGAFNTPGATASAGWIVNGPGLFTDSVDIDDGNGDGLGTQGWSFYSGNTQTSLTITFDAGALGQLPTHAGVVWTDVGNVLSGNSGFGEVIFEAFGPGNALLATIGPVTLGDGFATGATAEDRFFGVSDAGGITSIRLTMPSSVDWEVDHVQYGIIPAPGTLLVAGLMAAGIRRRR